MSFIARIAAAPDAHRRSVIALLLVVAGLLSLASVTFSITDPQLAAWWPAAGFAAMAGMLARGPERWVVLPLVVVATGLGNLLAGRDLLFALGLGLGNTVEVVIVTLLLAPGGTPVVLATLRQAARFIPIVLVASAATGAVLAVVVAVNLQRLPLESFTQLAASHASALLVMLPVVLVPLTAVRRARILEIAAQSLLLLMLIGFVYWPGNTWPVAFVPLVVLIWSALRFPLIVTTTQTFVTTAAIIVLTALGGGPFTALAADGRAPVVIVQAFMLVFAITALVVSTARTDWLAVVARLRAQEELLRDGIVAANDGIIIAERREGSLHIVAINSPAVRAIGSNRVPFGIDELDLALASGGSTRVAFEREGRTFDASIAERGSTEGPGLVTIVVTDVTERDERERVALESAEQLRRLNDQKEDFISAVSHELRTPVTSILGFSEQLESSPLPPEAAQAGEIIARNARRLADVIDDVLELSRLSALGGPLSAIEPVDLVSLATDCGRDSEGLVLNRRVSVAVSAPDGPVVVQSRARDLVRVCANLLSNAVKFSHDDGTVTIEVRRDGEGALVRVIDHGLGIPEEHRDMVWQRFARVPVDAHRAVPGTGLGLPIVKALVESRLGGDVSIAETPGGGTTAEVRLPSEAPAVSLAHQGN